MKKIFNPFSSYSLHIYSEICKEYDEKGLKIFGEDFTNKVKEFEAKAKSSGDDL